MLPANWLIYFCFKCKLNSTIKGINIKMCIRDRFVYVLRFFSCHYVFEMTGDNKIRRQLSASIHCLHGFGTVEILAVFHRWEKHYSRRQELNSSRTKSTCDAGRCWRASAPVRIGSRARRGFNQETDETSSFPSNRARESSGGRKNIQIENPGQIPSG